MRGSRALVALLLAAALVAAPMAVAEAVGTGNPVIAPLSRTHYSGFNGPFVVEFEDAPIDAYDYYVEKVPSGGGVPVLVGTKKQYDFNGSFTRPELRVSALSPGSYVFSVTDNNGHEASLPFTVSTGTPPTCAIVLPRTVRMQARSFLVTARLSRTCTALGTTYAAWEARHPVGGFAQTFIFSGTSTDTWRIYDDEYTGTYTVRPNSAKNSSNETVPQNTTRLVMKLDSRLSLTSSRSGRYVTLRTRSTHYSPSANRFKAWSNRTVVLSYRTCGTCSWQRLRVRTTNRDGTTSYRFRAANVRQYRAVAAGTTTTWAPRPDYVRR
ncbi:MAG: hypothetical protein NTV23_15505 [Propionibacteriales bacterium]|nr:hypothetical protein [Propionibacteriales bacterium]